MCKILQFCRRGPCNWHSFSSNILQWVSFPVHLPCAIENCPENMTGIIFNRWQHSLRDTIERVHLIFVLNFVASDSWLLDDTHNWIVNIYMYLNWKFSQWNTPINKWKWNWLQNVRRKRCRSRQQKYDISPFWVIYKKPKKNKTKWPTFMGFIPGTFFRCQISPLLCDFIGSLCHCKNTCDAMTHVATFIRSGWERNAVETKLCINLLHSTIEFNFDFNVFGRHKIDDFMHYMKTHTTVIRQRQRQRRWTIEQIVCDTEAVQLLDWYQVRKRLNAKQSTHSSSSISPENTNTFFKIMRKRA